MTKVTIPWLRRQIADEKHSSRMYREHGHPEIARQETIHRKRLEKQLERKLAERRR
jgi:hypothetical protein